ncbi:hypothetical protein Tco_0322791 [Tanacetum coccineum]
MLKSAWTEKDQIDNFLKERRLMRKETYGWVDPQDLRLFKDGGRDDGIDIYMLVEKEYLLSRGTLTLMLVAKLLVEQDSKMSRELLRKIFMQVERPRR